MFHRSFAIRQISTQILLRLELEIDIWGGNNDSIEHEINYNICQYGDLPVWTTENLYDAISVLNNYKTAKTQYVPQLNYKNSNDFEIVTVDTLNNSHTLVSSDNVPQSVFTFVKDMEEFLTIRHSIPDGTTNNEAAYTLFMAINDYNNTKDSYTIDSYSLEVVWRNLTTQNRIPDIPFNIQAFKKSLNDSLNELAK